VLKRVRIEGFIEIPEGAEAPSLGEFVTVGEFKGEVTSEGREKQKRRGDTTEMVYTSKVPLPEGVQILKVEAAPPGLFDDGDPEE
jgi:hypothetical protein